MIGPEVYFARCIAANGSDMGAIKIGCSWTVKPRLRAIATNVPFDCEIIGTAPGGLFKEAAVHMWLRADRIAGEYFRSTPAVIAFADHVRDVGELPLSIRQTGDEGPWVSMAGAKAFMGRHGLTVRDVAAVSGSKVNSYEMHMAKDEVPNRRFAAALTVAALERGHTVLWPDDFAARAAA